MSISSKSDGTQQRYIEECIIPDVEQCGRADWASPFIGSHNCARESGGTPLFYPWLIEALSRTFFREWMVGYVVPTKLDHTDWLCTRCGDYTAIWQTKSDTFCRYCWTFDRTSPLGPVPAYMQEVVRIE